MPDTLGAETPLTGGPRIVWDLAAEPLPELPLPNDVATWPDPTSRTGLRLNVSLIAPTTFEEQTRENFDHLDGWGTYGAITVPFESLIDVQDIYDRQGGRDNWSEVRWQQHAVYLVNLETGEPVPLDVNGGNFEYVLDSPSQYWRNDPHAGDSNLLFESTEEDVNGNGVMDPGEDTDFDGVLDHPNTFSGLHSDDPAAQADDSLWFYERETNTLLLKPILPLEQNTTYAVVVTERLIGQDGQSVRSPFPMRHHVAQTPALENLTTLLSERPHIYGSLAANGWDEIAFAWTYTTQSINHDIDTIRDGMYGNGSMAWIAEQFPPDFAPAPMWGGGRATVDCGDGGAQVYIAPGEDFIRALDTTVRAAFELDNEQAQVVLDSYANLSHVVAVFFEVPYFLGDPNLEPGNSNIDEVFQVDSQTGEARVDRQVIQMFVFVPKETTEHQQPFPSAFYVHGYGSNSAEPLPFAGFMIQSGVAAVMVNAEGHGLEIPTGLDRVIAGFFESECLRPTFTALAEGRALDIDGDGSIDSGRDFWTAYLFHTRDVVRQTVLDHMRAIQLLRTFDGTRRANAVSYPTGPEGEPLIWDGRLPGTGEQAIAGDFDGDGVPDFGGPNNSYFFTGGSLGGIISGIMAGAEPAVQAAAPIVGAGGLTDVGLRSDNGGVLNAMHLRMMGPFVLSEVSAGPNSNTSCAEGERTLYWLTANMNRRGEVEFACLPASELGEEDVLLLRNRASGEVGCAGATDGVAGNFRVGAAADQGDEMVVEVYRGARLAMDYGSCTFADGARTPDIVIDSWQVGNGRSGEGVCSNCAKFQQTVWEPGDVLVSPSLGLGNRRQTPDLRRLMFLAQHGLEPGDPINYARRAFLDPVTAEDTDNEVRNLFVVNSIGDQNVPLSAGNAYARAAGILPFLPADAPDELADWRAPASFLGRYVGPAGEELRSPNDVLIAYSVLEGVDRMNRHPMAGGPAHFLFDVDDVSEGRLRFRPDGRHQSTEADALGHPRLDTPLRWHRQSRRMTSPGDDAVWSRVEGQGVSALLNNYAVATGVHGFDEIVYPPSTPFDPAQYLISLIARYGATDGVDIRYLTDPDGHHCLEDSSCDFLGASAGAD